MLFERAQRIAVGGDDHPFATAQRGRDLGLIIGQHARDRVLQALAVRNIDPGIAAVGADLVRARGVQRRRRNVERAAPDLDLRLADPRDRLGLVEPGQPAIVALVQSPVLGHRQPQSVHRMQHEVERADRAGLDAGEAAIEIEPLFPDQRARRARFGNPGFGQVDIPPSGEAVLKVPLRLAVAEEDQSRHYPAALAFSSGRMAWSESRHAPARYLERSVDQP